MVRLGIVALAFAAILGLGGTARAGSFDGQWQGSSPQQRSPSGGFCSLGFFLDVNGNKLSGIVQTARGEVKFETSIQPDGSFTYAAGGAIGSGKFTASKFEATQATPCGNLTATGVHIG